MSFPEPKNYFAFTDRHFPLYDEFLDFQRLICGVHIGESKQKTSSVTVEIPVSNTELFQKKRDELENFFEWLTDRTITFKFISGKKHPKQTQLTNLGYEAVSLFSGGMDSGSLPLLDKYKKTSLLLHHTHTSNRMLHVAKILHKKCIPSQHKLIITNLDLSSTADIPLLHIRGAAFLTNLMSVAAQYQIEKIIIPENGIFMINFPVSSSVSPTRTTDPDMIEKLSKLFKSITNTKFSVETPYLKKTKAEVILMSRPSKIIQYTWSCSTSQGISKMCGLCMACFVRQMALYSIDLGEKLEKQYEYNPFLIKKNDLKEDRMTSFRILINCLEFWRNLIHPDSAATKTETERCENIVKIHPTFHKHATEMFLGLKNYCEKNDYEILGELGMKYLKEVNGEIEKRRKVLQRECHKYGWDK